MQPELDDTAVAAAPPAPALATTLPAAASHAPEHTATMPPSGPTAPAGAGLSAGHQLGHFRVERQLGAGGMGEVYLATDLALDRPVAIKVLPDALARDPRRRERLIREARAQARVVHPNVGHIYFIGEERGLLFVAMEYVPGETLAQRAATAPMSTDDALAAIRGAALGLREAHRAGFLHRDVKPSNLMIDGHGVLKVLDFGLAAGGPDAAEQVGDGAIAQTSLVGTPLYMAPEQARGEPIDARADIYALGATLFHVVSGRPPFEGASAAELRDLHSSAPRPRIPASTQPRTALALGELCARMMAPRAEDRFAGYDELIAAIDVLSTSRTRPAGFWARSFATLLDFGLAALAVALVAGRVAMVSGASTSLLGPYILAAFALYQTACVRRWGRTAGKALFELEVVRADTGERPTWAQAIRRSAAMVGVPLALSILHEATRGVDIVGTLTNFVESAVDFSLVVALAFASQRSHGKRALWDRISGTLVRYRAAPPAR